MTSFVTNNGLAEFVAALVADDVLKYVGWGEGDSQAVTDNDLDDAADEARTNGVDSAQTTNTTGDTFRVVGTVTAGAARAITEVGVFDGAGSGTPPSGDDLGIYGDFLVLNLETGDSITFTIDTVLDQAA